MKDLISIIITTKNSEKTLEDLLKSIKNQTYPYYEIIVVDNFSHDRTQAIAKKYTNKVFEKKPERSSQRNFGAYCAKGKFLFFLDSDMILRPLILEEAVSYLKENREIKGLIIPEESIGQSFWAKVLALEKNCYQGDELIEAARFFERKCFLEIKGYDENLLAGEDWDLHIRFKKKFPIGRIKTPIIHQEGNITLKEILKKKYYYAQNFPKYRKKHPYLATKQMNLIFRKAYFRNWKNLIKHPLLTKALFFLKTLQAFIGLFAFIKMKLLK